MWAKIRGILSWKLRHKAAAGAAVVFLGGLGFGAFRLTSSASALPTAEVKRKDFVDTLEIKGEFKALRTKIIAGPYGAGDLQIVNLVANAANVKKGDVLVQFDTSTMKQRLAQDQSSVKSAQAEISQSQAAARLKEEQDLTDVMTAKFDAEKARMDASKQEILSVIEGEQAKLKVVDAEETLKAAEAKLKADRSSAAADLASKKEKLNQAEFQVKQDERSLASLTLLAPLDGVVALQNHWQPAERAIEGRPERHGACGGRPGPQPGRSRRSHQSHGQPGFQRGLARSAQFLGRCRAYRKRPAPDSGDECDCARGGGQNPQRDRDSIYGAVSQSRQDGRVCSAGIKI